MVSLELDDIQGNILQGYGYARAAYRFFRVPDVEAGRSFLRGVVEDVTSAAPWKPGSKPATTTNIALTFSGLAALGVNDAVLAKLPKAFSEPIRERSARELGDTGASAPMHWVDGIGTEQSHILVTVHGEKADGEGEFTATVAALHARAASRGLSIVHCQDAQALDNQREHFGWADGFGQPSVEGVTSEGSRAGHGIPQPKGEWADVKAGEFVHGYHDEDGQVVSEPLLRNGTYMVYRKLYQDVAAFNHQLHREALRYGENMRHNPPLDETQLVELLAAKVVGRWRDGSAIALEPQRADTTSLVHEAKPKPSNDFRYHDDLSGSICPRGAHIRRTNPRDALGWDGTMTRRRRIIRRGMPYGPPADGHGDDDQDRGLIFICLNADIERQFEFIQSQWCNDGNAFGLGADKDYLLGDNTGGGKALIGGDPPHIVQNPANVVLTRGSEYLLMPGIRGLKQLAGLWVPPWASCWTG